MKAKKIQNEYIIWNKKFQYENSWKLIYQLYLNEPRVGILSYFKKPEENQFKNNKDVQAYK